MKIYFDNAATTPLDERVLTAMLPYLRGNFGNPSSIHALGRQSRAAIEKARKTVAHFLNASIGEIFFTSGGTESNNMALCGAVRDLGVQHIISSPLEHHCILHTLERIQQDHHTQIHFVELQANGQVDLTHLEQLLQSIEGKKLVSLMHSNNEVGNLLPLEQVAQLCHNHHSLFHSDTVQTFGYYPINVQATPISFLSGSAHKFHGPKGIGFIYINSDNHIHPFLQGGSQERNMRAGTENLYGIVGLGKAVEIAAQEMEADIKYLSELKQYFVSQLETHFPAVTFNGDCLGRAHCKVLNVAFPKSKKSDLLLLNLDIAGICASGGSACSSGVDVGSHVIGSLPTSDPEAAHVRFSFSKFNTKEEVDVVMEMLIKILEPQKVV